MKLLYLSGPFSNDDYIHGIEQNILNASKIALECWRQGWAVICPHKNTSGFQYVTDIPYERWLEGDTLMLSKCDAILMLPGWQKSNGACTERALAINMNIPVYDYNLDGVPPCLEFEEKKEEPKEIYG